MKKLLAIVLTAALLCTAAAVALAAPHSTRADGNIRFEGYVAGDGAGSSIGDWVGFWDTDPTETTQYTIFTGTLGAAYCNGTIYGYLYGYDSAGTLHSDYYTMDAKTHIPFYPEGASADGEMVYGMAYNYADNTMYALCNENYPYIASVNLETGELTKVVDIDLGNYLGLQTFAIDGEGNFYALTFAAISARLVKIDISTGALTELMSTGLPTFYAQSMTWDPQTDALYWAQVDGANTSSNGLYKIDVASSSLTYLGQIGTNFEITCLMVIPENTEPDPTEEPTGLLGDVDCNGTVNFADVALLYQYVMGSAQLTEQGVLNANVDGENGVTFADVSALYQMILIGQ